MSPTTRRTHAFLLTMFMILGTALPASAQQLPAATPDETSSASTPAPGTPAVDAGPVFVIHPAGGVDGDYFTLEAEAGTTNELTVVLGNADEEPMDLRTYASDAVPATNGGFAIADETTQGTGTVTWLDYPAETFSFEPGTGIERRFTVNVPEGTPPGQYIAGLALQTADPIAVEGSDLFNQIIRKAVAVFIIVPGPETPGYSLGTPELLNDGRVPQITIPVENSGNVLVKPRGTLTLRDATGAEVLSAPIAMGSIYAGTTVSLSIGIQTPVPNGQYSVSVELMDDATETTASLTGVPLSIVATEASVITYTVEGSIALLPDAT